MTLHKSYTIVIDTREKKPLLFPKNLVMLKPGGGQKSTTITLHTVREKLDTADYVLRGYERCCGVERKSGLRECRKNCLTKDRARFRRQLERLSNEFDHPVLLLEASVTQMLRSSSREFYPYKIVDALQRLCAEYSIPIHLAQASDRRLTGEWAARTLINYALLDGETK